MAKNRGKQMHYAFLFSEIDLQFG